MAGSGPRRREGEAQEEVRERLIDAFTRLAAERGYRGVSATDVALQAGLEGEAFYEHFANELRILIAAHDAFFERLFRHVELSCAALPDWPSRVAGAVSAGLEFLQEASSRARLFAVEALGAGPVMLERRFAQIDRGAMLLSEGRRRYPPAADLVPAAEWVLLGGTVSRISSHLLAEEAALLPLLAPELTELLLTPYLGAAEARRVAAAG